jgi:membrane protein
MNAKQTDLASRFRVQGQLKYTASVLWEDVVRCDLLKQASAMAYITLFSLVPSLAAVFTVISLFTPLLGSNSHLMNSLRGFILQNLAAGSGSQVVDYLEHFLGQLDLKKIGITSFAGIVFTLILLLRQIEQALNRIWLVRQDRNAVTRFVYFWTFLTLGVFAGSIVIGVVSGYRIQSFINVSAVVGSQTYAMQFLSSVLTWCIWVAFFFLAYKVIPNCPVGRKEAMTGALVAGTLLHQGGRLYGIYASNFTTYKNIYGALAAIPVFLFWIYICWAIILFGALIAWRMQQGFPKDESEDTVDKITQPMDRIRNLRIQEMLPLAILIVVHKNFDAGTARPVTVEDLVHRSKLPQDWIMDACEALMQLGLIAEAQPPRRIMAEAGGESEADSRPGYLPARPASMVNIGELHASLAAPAFQWLDSWQHDFGFDLPAVLRTVSARSIGAGSASAMDGPLTLSSCLT